MRKIRPFINTPVIKVFTGIRRCGKSVMLELVQAELKKQAINDKQIISLNFESASDGRVRTLDSILATIHEQSSKLNNRRLYLFFDEIQELI
ncbi:MAG TPA: AAA family ATPase, partial [Spirochaetota bacterium]|nr:AAA family ATPase [Spirochaetota bacterium]